MKIIHRIFFSIAILSLFTVGVILTIIVINVLPTVTETLSIIIGISMAAISFVGGIVVAIYMVEFDN